MHTKEALKELLLASDYAVERAMARLYERQTADEQSQETTKHRNGMGFAYCDARMGSYYGRWVKSGRQLTGRHLDRARRMACKYVGQLVEIANERSARPIAAHNAQARAIADEAAMQRMETAADRAVTRRDEAAKAAFKKRAESGFQVW